MKEEKVRNIIVAATVTAVTLLFVLLVFLVYQIISISVHKHEVAKLKSEISYYEQLIENSESEVDKYQANWWLEMRAWEVGMKYPELLDDIKGE